MRNPTILLTEEGITQSDFVRLMKALEGRRRSTGSALADKEMKFAQVSDVKEGGFRLASTELQVNCVAEFIELLRLVQARSGLTCGQIAAKTGHPRSSIYNLVSAKRATLPTLPQQVLDFLQACGLHASHTMLVMEQWKHLREAGRQPASISTTTSTADSVTEPAARPVHDGGEVSPAKEQGLGIRRAAGVSSLVEVQKSKLNGYRQLAVAPFILIIGIVVTLATRVHDPELLWVTSLATVWTVPLAAAVSVDTWRASTRKSEASCPTGAPADLAAAPRAPIDLARTLTFDIPPSAPPVLGGVIFRPREELSCSEATP